MEDFVYDQSDSATQYLIDKFNYTIVKVEFASKILLKAI